MQKQVWVRTSIAKKRMATNPLCVHQDVSRFQEKTLFIISKIFFIFHMPTEIYAP